MLESSSKLSFKRNVYDIYEHTHDYELFAKINEMIWF